MKAALILILCLGGCCPIGCDEDATLRPAGTIIVTENEATVVGANVAIQRFEEHPHWRAIEGTWQYTTDQNGQVVVQEERTTVTQYPLMMHGVGSFAWQVCAQKDGRAAVSRMGRGEPVGELVLELQPSDEPCDVLILNDAQFSQTQHAQTTK